MVIIINNDYIKKNGFFVNRETGLCLNEPIFKKDIKELQTRLGIKNKIQAPTKTLKNAQKWKKIGKYNKWDNKKVLGGFLYQRFQSVINALFDFFNDEQIAKLRNHVIKNQPKRLYDMYHLIFNYIYTHDLPILTSDLLDIIKNNNALKSNLKYYRHFKKFNNFRNYYWYISERLNKIPYLNEQKRTEFFQSIFNYYKIIRFQLNSACRPSGLIDYLIYEMINQHYNHVPKKMRSYSYFGITHFFKKDNQKQLLQLKRLKLDEGIPLKLEFVFKKKAKM